MAFEMLNEIQNKFLDLLLASGALKFGSFKTKSGRMSPFFFNSGAFDNGKTLSQVAHCYARYVLSYLEPASGDGLHLYGPAYKGITLATATAVELSKMCDQQVPFTFNRKENKTHGEGGAFIGHPISKNSSVVIIEDVMTGGTSIRETIELLKPLGTKIKAVLVGVDRMERGMGDKRASSEISENFGISVFSILTIDQIIQALWQADSPIPRLGQTWLNPDLMARISEYRREWGC